MLGVLYTLPNATDTIAQIGNFSNPIFNEMLPLTLLIIGFIVGLGIIGYMLGWFDGLFHRRPPGT